MRLRSLALTAVMVLTLPLAVRAESKPAVVIRIKSVDGLMSDAQYLAKLIGGDAEETFKQAAETIKTFTTEEGLGGIDTKRPFAVYGEFAEDIPNSPLVVLLPIANEKAFVDFLNNFMIEAKKGDDGIYSIENVPNLPTAIYFRFANKYAYAAINKAHIAKDKLLAPEKVLPAAGDDSAFSADLSLAKFPDLIKQLGIGQLEMQLAEAKQQKLPNETPAVAKLKHTAIDFVTNRLQMVLKDSEEVSLRFGLNQKKDDITLDLSISPKAGSEMQKTLKSIATNKSLFSAISDPHGAFNFQATISLPDEIKKLLGPAVDDLVKQAAESEKGDGKNFLKAFLEKLAPTLKSGEYDVGFGLRGPNKDQQFTAVAVARLEKGKDLENFLTTIVSILPENERKKVELNAASVGEQKIHKIVVGDDLPPEQKKHFGADSVYFTIRDDAIFVTFGADGLPIMKSIIGAQPKEAPVVSVQAAIARIAPLMDAADRPSAKISEEVFGKNPKGSDTFTLTVEGGEKLSVTLALKAKLIALAAKAQGAAP